MVYIKVGEGSILLSKILVMKNAFSFLAIICIAVACKKNTTTPTTTPPISSTGCGDGYICYTLDGSSISKKGSGYELSDTNLFVKYEDNTVQLSIDIFGKTTGNYNVTDIRKQGNGRIYYFPDANAPAGPMYMAETGNMHITDYDAANKTLSGTFSATLYRYNNSGNTFTKTDSVVITDGTFTKISVPKI